MPLPAFASSARACFTLAFALPLLAGCSSVGAAPPTEGFGGDGKSPGSGAIGAPSAEAETAPFMTVGEITPVTAATAAPPPPIGEGKDDGDKDSRGSGVKSPLTGQRPAASATASDSTTPSQNRPQGGRIEGAVVDSASGLSEADVRSSIAQHQAAFRTCYDLGSASAASAFQGTVALRAAIGPSGVVASVEVLSSTTKNQRVDACVADAIRVIQFPSKGGGAVIAFPIAFGR